MNRPVFKAAGVLVKAAPSPLFGTKKQASTLKRLSAAETSFLCAAYKTKCGD